MRSCNILILLPVIFSISLKVPGQEVYKGSNGKVNFTSDAPLELIQANSDQLKGVILPLDKSFAFKVSMKTFEGFNSSMQKTHFNENYIETDKYPEAIFEGKIIEDIDFSKPGTYKVRGKGKFNVHGVEQIRIIRCTLVINPESVVITSEFSVFLDEHNIKIPSVVKQKIAEEIMVSIKITLKAIKL